MDKKNKLIVSITGIVLVLLILVGLTYGYYLTRISGNTSDKSISIDMANLELTYSDGNGLIEAKSIIPGETIATKTFTVKNTGNAKVSNYVVYLDSVVNNFEDKNDLKLTLTCTSDIGNCNGTNITYPSTNIMLVTNDIEEKETQSYELKVEFIETNDDQSDNMNKEMSGNILIKDIKGLNNTLDNIKGTNNLVVENAKLLSNYKIYGNSFQETRSGKNLLNASLWSNSITQNGLTIQYLKDEDCFLINGTSTKTSNFAQKYINLSIDKTKKYSLSTKYISGTIDKSQSTSTTKYSLAYFGKNDELSKITNWKEIKLEESDTTASNVSIDTSYITAMWFYINEGITFNNYKVKIQLEENSTVTEYEKYGISPSPDYPSEIQSVGDLVTDTNDANYGKYKLPIKVASKNLFDYKSIYSDTTKFSIKDEILEGNNVDIHRLTVKIPEKFIGKSLTFSADLKMGGSLTRVFVEAYVNGVAKKDTTASSSSDFKRFSITFTPKTSNDYVHITFGAGIGTIYAKNIQLEESSKATEYEPYQEETYNIYLDEPLRKVDNYSDYIDFKSGKVIRNVKVDDNTGTKAISESFSKLNTPIEEKISLPTINLNSTKNYISIDTSTSPSNTELEYIK